MKRAPLLIAAIAAVTGCTEEDRSSFGAQLLVPDAIDVQWDERMNARDDGLGILVPVDLMAYDGATGEPLHEVRVDVVADADALVVHVDDVDTLAADCPECVWDSGRDRYVALPDGPSTPDGGILTDEDGMARVYVWIDAFPNEGDEPVQVDVDVDASGATFAIHGS
jgi:hypothetical protein